MGLIVEKIITKSFARLLGRGVHRGFITYDELFKSLGKRNLSQDNLSQSFIHILDEKIILVQQKSDFKALKKKDINNINNNNLILANDRDNLIKFRQFY